MLGLANEFGGTFHMTEVNRSVLNERRRLFMAESLSGDWAKLFEYAIHKDHNRIGGNPEL